MRLDASEELVFIVPFLVNVEQVAIERVIDGLIEVLHLAFFTDGKLTS